MIRTMIRKIEDRYGASWLVYTCTSRGGWTVYLACGSFQNARNAARRARRELVLAT